MHFQSYQVDGCENKEIFHRFLRAILACSDAFSLIYFRYKAEEEPSEGVSGMERELAPYMVDSDSGKDRSAVGLGLPPVSDGSLLL